MFTVKPQTRVRARRLLWLWLKLVGKRSIAPLTDHTAILNLLAFPLFLWLVFMAGGWTLLSQQALISWAATKALIYMLPSFVIYNMVTTTVSVLDEERKLGQWFGPEFVYNEPILVTMFQISNADNGSSRTFAVNEAEKGGYVRLSTVLSGFERSRLKLAIYADADGAAEKNPGPFWERQPVGQIRVLVLVPSSKDVYFASQCETSNRSIIKIYLESWSVY